MVVGEVCTAERPEGGRGGTIEEDTNMSEECTIIILNPCG